MQKTLIASGAITIGTTSAFGQIVTKQEFNFMTQTHPNLILIT